MSSVNSPSSMPIEVVSTLKTEPGSKALETSLRLSDEESSRFEKSGSGVEQAASTSPVRGSVTMTDPESAS